MSYLKISSAWLFIFYLLIRNNLGNSMQRKHVSKRNDFINLTNTANFPVCIKLNDKRKKIISTYIV